MAEAVPNEKLRQYLRELTPEARALLAAELERARLRGENPPGADMILEELRADTRDACSSRRSSRSWSTTRPSASTAAAFRAPA